MAYPTAEEIATKIEFIHNSSFGGKTRGRFRIEDDLMRELCGRPGRLEDKTFEAIRKACADLGFKITRLKEYGCYAVMEIKKMVAWRKLTVRALNEIRKDEYWDWK
ncbi:hypothetical protein [Pseudomonas violetae]|uniref:Uncharacterized protein n=1 Tax=Pseudomonas violetae TaxID=2915813 RepID=A0ABT0F8H3_9PSED|nr:hypothetical protein [Pseudomonas violetae]MCK1794280.1 hypothetical protein [Pseudomonas violetae]